MLSFFDNDETTFRLVEKFKAVCPVILDLDVLRRVVEQKSGLCFNLLHHVTSRLKVGNHDESAFIRPIFAV